MFFLVDYVNENWSDKEMKPSILFFLWPLPVGQIDSSWSPLWIGLYAQHMERWLAWFPRSQIHLVSGERLITDPAGELGKVQDFLGLQRIVTDKHFYFNKTKGFPCLKKPEGSSKPHCLGKTKGRTHVSIDPDVIQRLRDFYKPHNQRFYRMVEQDFEWQWSWRLCRKKLWVQICRLTETDETTQSTEPSMCLWPAKQHLRDPILKSQSQYVTVCLSIIFRCVKIMFRRCGWTTHIFFGAEVAVSVEFL